MLKTASNQENANSNDNRDPVRLGLKRKQLQKLPGDGIISVASFWKTIWLEILRTRKYYPTCSKKFYPKEPVHKKKKLIFASKFMTAGLVHACKNVKVSEMLNLRGVGKKIIVFDITSLSKHEKS